DAPYTEGAHTLITCTGAWQLVTLTSITTDTLKTLTRVEVFARTRDTVATTFYVDGLQLEQKPYATSWTLGGTTRASEVLTIPTTGVFQKGNWAVELTYIPKDVVMNSNYPRLFHCGIDTNNYYDIAITPDGRIYGEVRSGGTNYAIFATSPIVVGTAYSIMFSGDGTRIRLCINGLEYSRVYVEPIGTLLSSMNVGSSFSQQCNGIIDDLRISNRARTLAEHQAAYQSNQPLSIDASTTCKFSFDSSTSGYTTAQFGPGIESYWNYTSMNLGGGWSASVNTWNQNLILTKPLFSIPGRGLAIGESITYNSINKIWTFSNNSRIEENPDRSVTYLKGDGGSYTFTPKGSGGYTAPAGVYLTLQKNGTGNFTILDKYKNTYNYLNGKPNQFKDRNNNTTTFTYNSARLYQVSDPSGRKLTYTYDPASGNIVSITDPASHVYRFGYQNGNLTTVTDPDNKTFILGYDDNGHVSSFTDPLNRVTSFYCDPNGQLQRLRDARTTGQDVYETSFAQDFQGNSILTMMTDPGNKTTTFYHNNETGNLTKYHDALGHTWQYVWTSNNLMQSQDVKGTTSYQYDSNCNVTRITNTVDSTSSHNIVETMTYDSYSQLLEEVDGSGRTTSYKYSNKGELLSTANPELKESNGRKYDQYGNAIEYSPAVLGNHNLLLNGSMEIPGPEGRLLDGWSRTSGAAAVSLDGDPSGFHPHGNYSLKISSSTATTDWFYQMVSADPNDCFTLRADVKLDNVQPSGSNAGAFIEMRYRAGDGFICEDTWYCWGNGTVPLILTSYALPDYVCSYTVRIGLRNASGTAWFDGVQLEDAGNSNQGFILGSFNSVENNGFEYGLGSWSYSGTTPTVTSEAAWGGTRSLKMEAAGTTYQDVPVHGGEPLTFSGMVKTSNVTGTGAYCKIDYYNASNNLISGSTVQTGYVTGTQDFTRLTSLATAPANAHHARVQAILNGTGTVYFDAIKLIPRNSNTYTYDASNGTYTGGNYIIRLEEASGKQNNYTYDINTGNELSFTDARNRTTTYYYDSLNRLIRVRDPLLHNAYYGYDAANNCISTRDPRSSSPTDNTYLTSYGPDNLNKLETLTDPLSRNCTYTYDRSGNLTDILLPNGLTEHFEYDDANRLIKASYDNGKYFTFSYDDANNLIGVVDQDNNSYTCNYDGAHRLTNATDAFGYALTYQWDKSNNLTSITGTGYSCQYNYGSDNRLLRLTLAGSDIDYDYDESGRVFQVRCIGSYNFRKYNYLANGWCERIQDPYFPGQYHYDYCYYDDGTIDYYISWAGTDSFNYDADGRLTYWYYSPRSGTGIQENYSYDHAGNLLTKGNRSFTYNSANQITNAGFTYDNNGNMTGDGTYIYVYNALNQLIQVKRASDNSMVAEYKYNHDGLRKSKTVNGVTTTYNWDASGNLVRETTPSGTNYYYYDPSGNLAGLRKNNVTYIVHNNLRGDIVSITDTSGNIVAQYHFDPWGKQISYSGTLTQPFRYASYYYDEETGLYYLKSRYYSPVMGRFLTRDSIEYIEHENPQTLNLYSYCGNDPVNNTDSTGHWKEGDEKLSKSAQNEIKYLTNLYNKATSKASRDWIAKQADKIRTMDSSSSLPKTGTPNSKDSLYNPDGSVKQEREYGPDGQPVLDTDYNHGGANHEFPHEHVWENGVRGPARSPKISNAGKVTGWALVGTVVYWIVSEGSRILFPPRNLIPVP
ncbi:MAG: RHS repeat-associated core domain-containing protein, partial [Dehalobacterium sp.]